MKLFNWVAVILAAFFVLSFLLIYGISYLLFPEKPFPFYDLLPFVSIITVVLLLCQFFLLHLKVDIIENRPVAKRKITGLSIVIGFLLAVICFTILVVLFFVAFGEKSSAYGRSFDKALPYLMLVFFLGSWFFWAYVFIVRYWKNNAAGFMHKTVQLLITGSILEMLVAVPSHIIMRNRGDCCAPLFSYFGIVTGATIMLCAFGPGILFLFAHRMARKRANKRT